MVRLIRWFGIGLAGLLISSLYAQPLARGPMYAGQELDYQPSIMRLGDSNQLVIVLERLNPANLSGDLLLSSSNDNGATWSTPQPIIATNSNERHPALVQHGAEAYSLFYLSNATGGFRIHRATSSDGLTWTAQGPLELGWASAGEINPTVIVANGKLTMTYQRLGSPSTVHIAQSSDNGVTWDTQRTQIAQGQLPRLAWRAADNQYVVAYQTGNTMLQMYSKTSNDVYNWSNPAHPLSIDANSHDAMPIVLEDGTFFVSYVKASNATGFDVMYRTSSDGETWSPEVAVTNEHAGDVEPHGLLTEQAGRLLLAWGRPASASDYNIWLEHDLVIPADLSNAHLSVDQTNFDPGTDLNYTLQFTNTGLAPNTGQLTITMPTSVTLYLGGESASHGTLIYHSPNQYIWKHLLAVGEPISMNVRVLVGDLSMAPGTVLTTSVIIQTNDQRWPLSVSSTANGEQRIYLPFVGN
ncbi:exo-alpha-sialidase [Herpetosiphon llansteffanensis]|uniref:exo-alpha-sialidase n=1 Tax=Herpetosiphon llansteffanensis TaxID=2094568 RepID=UPI0013DEA569|nr:exo-alpha-sialidase [Herpetosiphon llansteffanensis]